MFVINKYFRILHCSLNTFLVVLQQCVLEKYLRQILYPITRSIFSFFPILHEMFSVFFYDHP
jgi:hypothetical protein